jgi:hypothetical protein
LVPGFRRLLARVRQPADKTGFGCTFVMGTGIVSFDLHAAGWKVASLVLLAIAAAAWALLALRGTLAAELAGVPATSVIATRLGTAAWVLLAIGVALLVWRRRDLALPARARGSDLLGVVALQSLAIVCGTVHLRRPGVALLALGLGLYGATIARFAFSALVRGGGDQWIAGGALAISGEACAKLSLHSAAVVLWVVALAWLPALLAGELARPRVGPPSTRWSTVFPLGMYAALSFQVSTPVAEAMTVIALIVWALVLLVNLMSRRASIPALSG